MKRILAISVGLATIMLSGDNFAKAQQAGQESQGAQSSQPGASANQPGSSLKVEFPQGLPPASAGASANQPSPRLKTGGKPAPHHQVHKIDAMTLKQTHTKNSKKKKQIRDVQRYFD